MYSAQGCVYFVKYSTNTGWLADWLLAVPWGVKGDRKRNQVLSNELSLVVGFKVGHTKRSMGTGRSVVLTNHHSVTTDRRRGGDDDDDMAAISRCIIRRCRHPAQGGRAGRAVEDEGSRPGG